MPRQPKHNKLSNRLSYPTAVQRSRLLKHLLSNVESQDALGQRVDECLPPLLKGKFQVAGLEQGLLTLVCSSASLATRFRFDQERFLAAMKMRLGASKIKSVRLQVRPGVISETTKKTTKSTRHASESLTEEQRLEGVMERLNSRST